MIYKMAAESEVKAEQINWHYMMSSAFDPLHLLSLGDSSEGEKQFLNGPNSRKVLGDMF